MDGLKGEVIVVTGGASGIGQATCLRLAREGCRVAVCDVNPVEGARMAEECRSISGVPSLFLRCDVTSAGQVAEAMARVDRDLGAPYGLVNSAGIALGEGGVVACSEDDWDRVLAVNLKSIFLTGKYCLPFMVRAKRGAIVTIASVFGFTANPDECGYAASKGAILNLTRQMAIQHAPDGIRVNTVCPSDCDTPLITKLLKKEGAELEAAKEELAKPIPLGRLARASEVAAGVAFLLSREASFITGVALPIDGGFLCR